jgi:PKD repeat protein
MKKTSLLFLTGALAFLAGCNKLEHEPPPVNHVPVARISASVTEGDKPLTVEFDASQSSDPDEDILTYQWDLGNGSTSASISPSTTYRQTGSFTVTLTVTDEGGLKGSEQIVIKVNEPPDLFPMVENAQWVYLVEDTETENGNVTGYETGYLYLTVEELDQSAENIDFITLRITGKRFYNGTSISVGDRIFLSHVPGSKLKVYHQGADAYYAMIDLDNSSWSGFAMFFSQKSSQSVSLSTVNLTIGLGSFPAYKVKYHRDNWGETYVTERFDVTEIEYVNPDVGLLYRETSRYDAFLDCFTCPVYGGSEKIELVGYYIPYPGGNTIQEGSGINPNNPYGGTLGLLTIWASEDIGYTDVYIDGEYSGMITNYWPDGLSCGEFGALNISYPAGSYTLTAESNKGYYWEGSVYFTEGACDKIELTLSSKGMRSAGKIFLKD